MATLDWPAGRHFVAANLRFGVHVPKSGWAGFFVAQQQTLSHEADRLRCTVSLPPCGPDGAAEREAFFAAVVSAGHWVRLGRQHQLLPRGTLRGTPTVAANAAAGARTLQVQGVVGDTLLAADALGSNGQLMLTGYAGAVANGSGVLTVPLVMPLRVALAAAAALTWQEPTGTWQLAADLTEVVYGRAGWQAPIEVPLIEVF